MADLLEDVNQAETLGILALIVVIGYALYKFGGAFACQMNLLFGTNSDPTCGPVSPGASPGNSYIKALGTTISDPTGSMKSILGIGAAYPGQGSNYNPGSITCDASGCTNNPVLVGTTPVDQTGTVDIAPVAP